MLNNGVVDEDEINKLSLHSIPTGISQPTNVPRINNPMVPPTLHINELYQELVESGLVTSEKKQKPLVLPTTPVRNGKPDNKLNIRKIAFDILQSLKDEIREIDINEIKASIEEEEHEDFAASVPESMVVDGKQNIRSQKLPEKEDDIILIQAAPMIIVLDDHDYHHNQELVPNGGQIKIEAQPVELDASILKDIQESSILEVQTNKLKPALQDVHLQKMPPVEKGNELTALCRRVNNNQIQEKKENRPIIVWVREGVIAPDTTFLRADPNDDISPQNLDSPLQYFLRYIGDDLFEEMVQYTNMYALQEGITSFKPTDRYEIKTLIALHIAIGLFLENMSRDRFFQLRTSLHFVDIRCPANNKDKFYKIRPLLDSVQKRCSQLELNENLCIDEQMIPFTGNLNMKQYVKGKPYPWGIKNFYLWGQTGLAYDFILYQRKKTGKPYCNLRKEGRLSSACDTPLSSKTIRREEKRINADVQFDTINHMLQYDKNKEPTRCKFPGCKQRSHIFL
ncbi:hypothetical protein NQ314_018188 [Rhamnusium bicolor]|uniref:PiggyBac transposable element-derived protein domain-containing protein n=1 Tax=Rhamnusium bicolor TaxID=1586634 RepID=A0AAV8WRW1_9CUCU|nr:hypothetical protein NQ314_018188 [Rhamnusium bicolor]